MEARIKKLEEEIEKIKARNKRVELDKTWELSRTRTGFIAVSTYILIVIFMILIKDNHPFLNGFFATVVYLISSSTHGVLKRWWLKRLP